MIARQRNAFDACAHLWRSFLCVDIGRPDSTAIPAELHPAVLEDEATGPTERLDDGPVAVYDGPLTWTQGEKVKLIRSHIYQNGPMPAAAIAEAIGDNVTTISNVLKRHGSLFEIVEYKKTGRHKAAVWGLKS